VRKQIINVAPKSIEFADPIVVVKRFVLPITHSTEIGCGEENELLLVGKKTSELVLRPSAQVIPAFGFDRHIGTSYVAKFLQGKAYFLIIARGEDLVELARAQANASRSDQWHEDSKGVTRDRNGFDANGRLADEPDP